jgi:prevent-host-death family protein
MYIYMYIGGMTRKFSIAEARSRLRDIVDQAEAGQDVELTRRGRPVAVVISHRELERLRGNRQHFTDAYHKFLETFAIEEVGLEDELVVPRDKSPGRRVSI